MTILSIVAIIFAIGVTLFIIGMMNKNKIIKYIGLIVLIVFAIFCGYLFYIENDGLFSNKKIILPQNDMLPTADRIIYKDGDSNYYVITPNDKEFNSLFAEVSYRVDMRSTSQSISDEEIQEIKNKEKFIELDYNTKSKNKIFPLEEKEIGMINMKDSGGEIVKRGVVDKEEFIKVFEKTKKNLEPHKFEKGQNYISNNKFSYLSDELLAGFNSKQYGIYQMIINDNEKLEEICNKFDFSSDTEIPSIDFKEKNVIVTCSFYDIDRIEENVGNLKYYFKNYKAEYDISIYVVSKIANINCIYCNVEDVYSNNYYYETSNHNTMDSGIIKNISDNTIEIADVCGNTQCIININNESRIMNFTIEKDREMEFYDIQLGDSVYVEGNITSSESIYKTVNATDLYVYKKENLKKYFENELKGLNKIDGCNYQEVNIDNSGNGYVTVELAIYEERKQFVYPVKINVNSKTEHYLGMAIHLQSNYGYHPYEICDITLNNKITDIDNIQGTAKMIEYIAD